MHAKETYDARKRDLLCTQKRPTGSLTLAHQRFIVHAEVSKETCYASKRVLLCTQKRPTDSLKLTYQRFRSPSSVPSFAVYANSNVAVCFKPPGVRQSCLRYAHASKKNYYARKRDLLWTQKRPTDSLTLAYLRFSDVRQSCLT